MPFIVGPIVTLLFAAGLAEAAVVAVSEILPYVLAVGASLVISAVTRLLTKTSQPSRALTIQSPIAPRRVVYGRQGRLGGVLTFVDSWTDGTGSWIGLLLTFAGHQIQSFDALWLNGDQLYFGEVGDDESPLYTLPLSTTWQTPSSAYVGGNATTATANTTRYNNLVWCQANLGSPGQAALTEPIAVDSTHWTSAHRQAGCAHIFVAIQFTNANFSSGLPVFLVDVHGKNDIYDPRGDTPTLELASITDTAIATTSGHVERIVRLPTPQTSSTLPVPGIPAFGPNAQLVVAGVTGGSPGTPWNGTFTPYRSVDSQTFILSIPSGGGTSSGTGGTCVVENNNIGYSENAALCLRDYLTNPTAYGLQCQLSELDDVQNAVAANICDEAVTLAAGGTEPRYALNGIVDTAHKPADIISSMLSACAGRLVYRGGLFGIYPGAYLTPTLALDESDIRGPIEVVTSVQKNELCNGVKGVFIYPGASASGEYWSSTDFPPVLSDTYVAEDSGEILWRDVQFDFTISFATAQRLAKIDLERARRQKRVTLPCKLTAYQAQVLDTVQLTITRYGWNNKTFEVIDVKLSAQADHNGSPALGVDLTLQETDSGIYAWSAEEEPEGSVLSPLDYPDALPAGGEFSYILNAKPGNGEVDAIYTFAQATTFPGNFAGSFGILLTVPAVQNPWTCHLQKNGSNIGTVISTAYSSQLTFTTTSGDPIAFNPGDTLSIEYPSTADTAAAGVNLTFVASS